MSETTTPLEAAIGTAMEVTGWTRQEVVNVISAVRGETPDALLEAIGEVLEWCSKAETSSAMVSVWKTLPPGVMEIRWMDGEPACRFRPELKITETQDGWSIDLPTENAHV